MFSRFFVTGSYLDPPEECLLEAAAGAITAPGPPESAPTSWKAMANDE
jgi:hypothetical protein